MEIVARSGGAASETDSIEVDAATVERTGDMRIRRRTPAASTRAKRSAEPVMHNRDAAEEAATHTVDNCDGDRKSAD